MTVLIFLLWLRKHPSEGRAESGPEQCKGKTDKGQQERKAGQRCEVVVITGEDIGFHRHDAVDVDFRIDKLQEKCGQKAALRRAYPHLRRCCGMSPMARKSM